MFRNLPNTCIVVFRVNDSGPKSNTYGFVSESDTPNFINMFCVFWVSPIKHTAELEFPVVKPSRISPDSFSPASSCSKCCLRLAKRSCGHVAVSGYGESPNHDGQWGLYIVKTQGFARLPCKCF